MALRWLENKWGFGQNQNEIRVPDNSVPGDPADVKSPEYTDEDGRRYRIGADGSIEFTAPNPNAKPTTGSHSNSTAGDPCSTLSTWIWWSQDVNLNENPLWYRYEDSDPNQPPFPPWPTSYTDEADRYADFALYDRRIRKFVAFLEKNRAALESCQFGIYTHPYMYQHLDFNRVPYAAMYLEPPQGYVVSSRVFDVPQWFKDVSQKTVGALTAFVRTHDAQGMSWQNNPGYADLPSNG
jgi:hypothetical protein